MKIVLLSTYELGRQPFGLYSPAAWLSQRGHDVTALDLSRQAIRPERIHDAKLIAVYLPMHTATRLAAELIPQLRQLNPDAFLCCYGLYAPMNAEYLRALGVNKLIGGEFEAELANLAQSLDAGQNSAASVQENFSKISLDRLKFSSPDRSQAPPLQKYAHLVLPDGTSRIVGSTEASRGCKHLCRHCPIVPVYNGVFRVVPREVVLDDVRKQIAAGAKHISFGDPDFFNGIGHALSLLEEFHNEFPEITFDVTIKIEHLKKYKQHLPLLKDAGCLFVISAVESVSDEILLALDKGHSRSDFLETVSDFREAGLTLHPTFVPFTPWTTRSGYLDLLRTIYEQGLVENVAPIQLGIRLLIPEGSRILELDDIRAAVGPFEPSSLTYPWKNPDSALEELSEKVMSIAAQSEQSKENRAQTFTKIWNAAHEVFGETPESLPVPQFESKPVPFLSEPWYCCAEPTKAQLVSIGTVPQLPEPATAAIGNYL